MQSETWKPVVGFEKVYEISDLGRIRRTIGVPGTWVGRILKPTWHPCGYTKVILYDAKRCRQALVHHFVAEAFIGPRPDRADINHINGDKKDNRAVNLEYMTRRENLQHAREVLGRSNAGVRHGMSRFTEEQVTAIRRRRAEGGKLAEIAAEFGTTFQTVSDIVRRKRWRHIP